MDGPDADLLQSCEKILGHIDRFFKAAQPVVGGTHSIITGREQKDEKYEPEKACNDEDTASLETFACRLTWQTYIIQPERLAAATMRWTLEKRRPNLAMPRAGS